MSNNAKPKILKPVAFVNSALRYCDAANELFGISENRPRLGAAYQLSDQINLLYFHAVELGLKAFLLSKNIKATGHSLEGLYKKAKKAGLVVGTDDQLTIGNIASLLDSANKDQNLRYFNLRSSSEPDLEWTREVVNDFLGVIAPLIKAQCPGAEKSGQVAKITMIIRPNDLKRRQAAKDGRRC